MPSWVKYAVESEEFERNKFSQITRLGQIVILGSENLPLLFCTIIVQFSINYLFSSRTVFVPALSYNNLEKRWLECER